MQTMARRMHGKAKVLTKENPNRQSNNPNHREQSMAEQSTSDEDAKKIEHN